MDDGTVEVKAEARLLLELCYNGSMQRSTFVAIFSIYALLSTICLMPMTMAKGMSMPSTELSMDMSFPSVHCKDCSENPPAPLAQHTTENCLGHCLSQAKPLSSIPPTSPLPLPSSSFNFFASLSFPLPGTDDLLFVPDPPHLLILLLSTVVLRQ